MSTTILLVDDHRIVREGLRTLLGQQPDLTVVGEASDGRDAVAQACLLRPDVIVMDIAMPELNGVEATRLILAQLPAVRIVALSMYADRRFVAEILRAGALGYVLKDGAFEELALAIRTVTEGKTYLSPSIAGLVVEELVRRTETPGSPSLGGLTPRERQVLKLLADGMRPREIAQELAISAKTVEVHKQNLMNKLEIHTASELTRFAIREGLSTP
ncbi:MAG: response regulator transcription factor [Holophagales bacterium]|jgi:DNA-binding NarL/FixJ family response regulator|nr:response regulator transcription factor [Holophagales bacterium]